MKRTPLRRISKKHAAALREYSTLRRAYLKEHPTCEVCEWRNAKEIHHKEGRGPNLNRTETWLAICRNCHTWIHEHPKYARQKGLLK